MVEAEPKDAPFARVRTCCRMGFVHTFSRQKLRWGSLGIAHGFISFRPKPLWPFFKLRSVSLPRARGCALRRKCQALASL